MDKPESKALVRVTPAPSMTLARNLEEAAPRTFVHIDARGQVRSPARYRAIEAASYGALGGITLGVTIVYGAMLGFPGVALGAGVGVWFAWLLRRGAEPGSSLSQPVMAFLLIAILIPAIALMALYSRKVAIRRAEDGGVGSGRMHVRLVALFSAIAAVPTVLVAIFASVLFQSGIEFWFSDRARGMLENTGQVAQATYRYELGLVGDQATTMSNNMAEGLTRVPIDDPRVGEALAAQTYLRSLNEAAIVRIPPGRDVQSFGVANGYLGMIDSKRLQAASALLAHAPEGAYVDARTQIGRASCRERV